MPNSYTPGLSHIRSITWYMFGTSINVKHRVTGELHFRWNSDHVFLFPKQRVWWKICSTNTRPMLMGWNQVLDKHWQIIDHFKFMVVTGLLPHWSIEHSLSHTVAKRLWSVLPILSIMREFLAMNSVTHSSISSIINQGGSWGTHNSLTWRQWQLRFLHHHGALDYDVILWPKMAKKRGWWFYLEKQNLLADFAWLEKKKDLCNECCLHITFELHHNMYTHDSKQCAHTTLHHTSLTMEYPLSASLESPFYQTQTKSRVSSSTRLKWSYAAAIDHLCSWGELGGICPCVVGHRVGQMVRQILQWALSSDNGLHEEAKSGEHGQSAVLQLLHL